MLNNITMKRKITLLGANLLLLIMFLFGIQAFAVSTAEDNLSKAYAEKLIDKEEYLVFQFQRILQPDKVPAQYRLKNSLVKRDLTPLLIEARIGWEGFRQETKELLSFINYRPTDTSYVVFGTDFSYNDTATVYSYSTSHYKIHYVKVTGDAPDLTDANNNGHPDYVENMGSTFENVYTEEITNMGYSVPPDDGTEGGDSNFDVYIKNIGSEGIYGWAQAEGLSSGNSYYSFMVMDNDYTEFPTNTATENMQVTAAHEFHHSVQMGYNVYSSSWYKEVTSTWMEDEVYDNVNDNYQYMESWFNAPEVSLDIDDGDGTHEYGSWIFNKYLSEKFDASLIRDIWDQIKSEDNALPAIESALTGKSTDLKTEFTHFTGWNYDKTKYSEGTSYPDIKIENNSSPYNTYPLSTKTTTIDNLAAKYYKFLPDPSKSGQKLDLIILFRGPDYVDCGAIVVTVKNGVKDQHILTLDSQNDGSYTIDNFGTNGADSVILIMSNGSQSTDGASFEYEAKYAGVDVALVIDRSGSMSTYDYMDPAKAAASNFVALMQNGDQVAVASFSSYATVNFPLTYIDTSTVKQSAQAAISSIYASGSTSIGSGIVAGQSELMKNTTDATQGMILLSDGFENYSPFVADVLPNVPDNIDIFTIALGANSDQQLLNNIATSTGGFFNYASDASSLVGIYNTIRAKVTNQQNVSSQSGTLKQGQTVSKKAVVDKSMRQVSFSLSFNQNKLGLTLRTPTGTTIDSASAVADPKVTYTEGSNFLFYNIEEPQYGEWELLIEGKEVSDTTEEYFSAVAGDSDLEIDINFNRDEYGTNDPILITATVLENQNNILGASIEATIEKPNSLLSNSLISPKIFGDDVNDLPSQCFAPNGKVLANTIAESVYDSTLVLFDDGMHRDNLANDGIYANYYLSSDEEGSYNIKVNASKTSAGTKEFERESAKSTFVEYSINSQPFLISPTQISAYKGDNITYVAEALNFDGDSLVYSFENLPVGLTAQDSVIKGRISTSEKENIVYFTVKVTDEIYTDSMQVGIVLYNRPVTNEITEINETGNSFYNMPNPFTGTTSFVFELAQSSDVRLNVFSIQGQYLKTIHSGKLPEGSHQIEWNASGLDNGVYFVRIETNTFQKTIRTILMK